MAYSTISKPSLHFNTKLYTGNGSARSLTGVGFQPDWVWIKSRSNTYHHELYDVVRGVQKGLNSNRTNAEETRSGLTSFDSDGFSIGTAGRENNNGDTFVAWNWKAGTGQGSSNTAGSINTTYTSVNTTAGFSICQWSGSGSNATIGHGLGAVPKMIICKDTSDTYNWGVYHASLGNTKYLYLNSTAAAATSSSVWNDTTPTSTVFSVGSAGASNASGTNNMIAYCFAEKPGYSKFNSYEGNGNSNGTFVYTGFKPAWVMVKRTNNTTNWGMNDTKRDFNGQYGNDASLYANENGAETTSSSLNLNMLSNGFKLTSNNSSWNDAGSTYIYLAFAEEPLVANVGGSIPATAV